jgi:hypothetical protein
VVGGCALKNVMAALLSGWAVHAAPVSARSAPAEGIRTAAPIPAGYKVLASARITAGHPTRRFVIVATGRRNENSRTRSGGAPARPLLIFEEKSGRHVLQGRNDHVVFRRDEGGQCDPFLDGEATIAAKGRYFTVENGVACGQHWTVYVTFRLDDRVGFIFDNLRAERWILNPSDASDAEALVRDGPPRVVRDRPSRVTTFAAWRPTR